MYCSVLVFGQAVLYKVSYAINAVGLSNDVVVLLGTTFIDAS